MGRRKTGLDLRILETADRLFYARGYTNTGISQIVEEAGTNKPGLYTYFESKDELARRYLAERNAAMTARIVKIGAAASGVEDFFRRWMTFEKNSAEGKFGEYYGCSLANFALQTDCTDLRMQEFVQSTGRRWETQLVAYLRSEIKAGRFSAQPGAAKIARRMLLRVEGAITMWKLTGRTAYFDEAVEMFQLA